MKRKASTLEQLLTDFFDMMSRDINTCIPGVVERKNSDNTVEVKPAIKKVYSDGRVVELPLLLDVPVLYPFSSKFSLSWPLEKGDPVIVIFSQRSIERWKSRGGVQLPGDRRHHDLSDGFCLPCGAYKGQQTVDTSDFVMEYGDAIITMKESGQVDINGNFTVDK